MAPAPCEMALTQDLVEVPEVEPVPKDPFVSDLKILVVPAQGSQDEVDARYLSAGPFCDVLGLKKHIAQAFGIQVKDMCLFFRNPSGLHSQRLELLDDEFSLKYQGVATGATIICQVAAWDRPISKLGDSAYYMWSTNSPAVPDSIRVQHGGAPVKLDVPSQDLSSGVDDLTRTMIKNYRWSDVSRREVKIYISAEQEAAAVAAAGSESDDRVRARFGEQRLQVDVRSATNLFTLEIACLEHKIVPAECKVKVVANKRIVVTLLKAKEDSLWNTLVHHG